MRFSTRLLKSLLDQVGCLPVLILILILILILVLVLVLVLVVPVSVIGYSHYLISTARSCATTEYPRRHTTAYTRSTH